MKKWLILLLFSTPLQALDFSVGLAHVANSLYEEHDSRDVTKLTLSQDWVLSPNVKLVFYGTHISDPQYQDLHRGVNYYGGDLKVKLW